MSHPIKTTLKALTATGNEAAVELLIEALDSPVEAIRLGAVRALLRRKSQSGRTELLSRWHTIDDSWKDIIRETPGRLSAALRGAVLGTDRQMCVNGCDAALDLREYDLIPALLTVIEDSSNAHKHKEVTASTLIRLVEKLFEELTKPTKGRDPKLMREHVLGSLEQSVDRFLKHRRTEILEAFLMLAGRDNPLLRRILQNPHDAAYLSIVEPLSSSDRPGILRLVLSFLDDPHAPSAIVNIVARRHDDTFLRKLFDKIGDEPPKAMRINLKRMKSLPWLHDHLDLVEKLDESHQQAIVKMVVLSGMNRIQAFDVIRHILRHGKPLGRRAAAEALGEYRGHDANHLAMAKLTDEDPHVQASILKQIRSRNVPGSIAKLIEAIEHPHEAVQNAARESLSEFNIQRYLSAFEMLEEDVRQSTGRLVKKVDLEATTVLAEELQSGARSRRLRAIRAAMAMDAVQDVEQSVLELLGDEDHFVRAETAVALSRCNTASARDGLRDALLDRSIAVQEAAERSLQILADLPAPRLEGSVL